MTLPPTPQYNRTFSDPNLTVEYDKALRFVQLALKRFPHGSLKKWAADNAFTYSTLVTLRSNGLRRKAPQVVQEVLSLLKFPTELIRVTRNGETVHDFVFPSVVEIDAFHHQLSEYEYTKPAGDAEPARE